VKKHGPVEAMTEANASITASSLYIIDYYYMPDGLAQQYIHFQKGKGKSQY
jgi:hypothetical protein